VRFLLAYCFIQFWGLFFYLAVLGVELRALSLPGRRFMIWAMLPAFYIGHFWDGISPYVRAGLDCVLLFVLACVAGKTGAQHLCPVLRCKKSLVNFCPELVLNPGADLPSWVARITGGNHHAGNKLLILEFAKEAGRWWVQGKVSLGYIAKPCLKETKKKKKKKANYTSTNVDVDIEYIPSGRCQKYRRILIHCLFLKDH
jgi:hypothetical protein